MEISNEVRALEIHEKATAYYRASEQFGYKFLMEVKIIRDEKLYKELGYEDFEQYTLGCFGYSRETITNRIKTAEAWGTDYVEALRHFGITKTHQLATMPQPERSQTLEHGVPTNDGVKPVEEATTREIANYQKQLKEQEKQLKQKEEENQHLKKSYNEQAQEVQRLKNKPAEVVEKPVVPEDYEILKERNEFWKKRAESLDSSLKLANSKYKLLESSTAEAKELKKQIDSLKGEQQELTNAIQATKDLHELEKVFNDFFDKNMAPIKFKGISNYLGATNAVNRIHELVNLAESWVEEMRRLVPSENRKILEGEIIDE